MPYKKTSELPEKIKENLPKDAEKIFKEAYNSAWKQYENPEDRRANETREEVSNKAAWTAVKQKYKKDEKGNWVKKIRRY